MLTAGKVLPFCTIIHPTVVGSHCFAREVCVGGERRRVRTVDIGDNGGACVIYVQTTDPSGERVAL